MSKLVSQFKFKGAQVTITQNNKQFDLATWKMYQDIKRDLRITSSLIRKYDFDTHDKTSALATSLKVLKVSKKQSSYSIKVTMQDYTESLSANVINIATRMHIRDTRHSIVRRLRNKKQRYSKIESYSYSPSSLFNTRVGDNCYYYGSNKVGYVHSQSGDILRLFQRRKSKRMFEPVKPMTAERHVGIEIECGIACSREELAIKLGHLAGYVMIKGDGSVSVPNRNSVELNVCAPVSMYKSILKQVTNVLNDNHVEARVNKTCGLHVHLDIREFEGNYNRLNDMYGKLHSIQSILYSMQPKSRQDNNYCKRSKSRSISRGTSRYLGINAQAIWKYRTIEVRLHAGTTDFVKIANWIDLLCGVMYSNTITPRRSLSSVRSFFRTFNEVPTALMEYVVERIRKFEDGNTEENETAQAI